MDNYSKSYMTETSRELAVFIINDGDLYRQNTAALISLLHIHKHSGKWDTEKAVKAMMHLTERGACK